MSKLKETKGLNVFWFGGFMNIKSKRLICGVVASAATLFAVVPIIAGFTYEDSSLEITFINNTKSEVIATNAKTVSEFLKDSGIELKEDDQVIPALDTEITPGSEIILSSKKPVLISYGDFHYNDFTSDVIDKDYLGEIGVALDEDDEVSYDYDKASNILVVTAKSVEETTIEEKEVIEKGVIEIPDDTMYKGDVKYTKKGKNGLIKKTYDVRYENGVEVSKMLVSEELVTRPEDAVRKVGTQKRPYEAVVVPGTTTAGAPTEYKSVINVTATAYDLSYASCGKNPGDRGYGITASGMRARYGVIAVDPRVIPLGTKLYIEATDGSWSYGYAIAGDTGGAIKGARIDLFYDSHSQAISFGRRSARVYIL